MKISGIWIISISWVFSVVALYTVATVNFSSDPLTVFGILDSILSARSSNFADFGSYFAGLIVAPVAAFFALRQWKESRDSLALQRKVTLQELHNAEIQDTREALSNVQQKLSFMKMNNVRLNCMCSERNLTWGQIIHSNLLNDCCLEEIRKSFEKDANFLNFHNTFNGQLNEYGMLLCMLSRTNFSDLLLSQYVTDYAEMVRMVGNYNFAKTASKSGKIVTGVNYVRDSLIEYLKSPANEHRDINFIERMLTYLTIHLTSPVGEI